MNSLHALLLALATTPGLAQAATPVCSARSPPYTVALVELYTADACESCRSADRWLASLHRPDDNTARLVPIALHLNSGDYVHWRDTSAKREAATRQNRLARLRRPRPITHPIVVLQGQDFPAWGSSRFERAVSEINARAPRARIDLSIESADAGELRVEVAAALGAGRPSDYALFVGAYEDKGASQAPQEQDASARATELVVREWSPAIAFGPGGSLRQKRSVALLPAASTPHSGVVAFVQARGTGEVLQVLRLPVCIR
jgi:hypothetical protein